MCGLTPVVSHGLQAWLGSLVCLPALGNKVLTASLGQLCLHGVGPPRSWSLTPGSTDPLLSPWGGGSYSQRLLPASSLYDC